MNDNYTVLDRDNIPKLAKLILFLVPLLGIYMLNNKIDNDFYFLYKMGEFIWNNGFPTYDILSMHSEMELVVQQWLCDVVFYKLYCLGNEIAVTGFCCLMYCLFLLVFYKTCKAITDNYFTSIVITTVSGLLIAGTFVTRPQSVTFVVFILLFYVLEQYIKTNKWYWLLILPILSIFLINWHASMWWLLFVFMLPYFVNSIPVKLKKIEQKSCCNFFALLCSALVMFAVGFINPYGVDAVTYLFGSYGVDEINNTIEEMQPSVIGDWNGLVLFGLVFVFAIIYAISKDKFFESRFFCLTAGTIVLALSSVKGLPYFLICGFLSLAYFLKNLDFKLKVDNKTKKRTKKEKIKLVALILMFAASILILVFTLVNDDETNVESKIGKKENLNEIVEVLDEKDKSSIVLYTDFNNGQYLEFRGYKPYIDGRAEVFLEKNNKSFDYFVEYVDVMSGRIYYKEFVDKYNFTHIILSNKPAPFYNGLAHDENYQIICENDDFVLFEKIG